VADKKRGGLGVDALFLEPPASQPVEQPTIQLVKATVSLPADDEKTLDDLWRALQRRAGLGNCRKVTKGDVLALALQEALKVWKDDDTALNQLAIPLVKQSTSRTDDQ